MCSLPRLRAPDIVHCIVSFFRQLPCFLMVWPYASFLALTVSNSSLFSTSALLGTHSFVFFAVHTRAESFSALSSQRRQDVFFILSECPAFTFVSSLKSVCYDLSIFSAVMSRSPAPVLTGTEFRRTLRSGQQDDVISVVKVRDYSYIIL